MILGRVVGEVWATQRHPGLHQWKLLIVQPHLWYDPPFEVGHLIAVDPVGAGVGEDVLVCMGDAARRILVAEAERGGPTPNLPVDAAVMAIVDHVELSEAALRDRPLRFLGKTPSFAVPR